MGVREEAHTENPTADVREAHQPLRCSRHCQGKSPKDEQHGRKVEVAHRAHSKAGKERQGEDALHMPGQSASALVKGAEEMG